MPDPDVSIGLITARQNVPVDPDDRWYGPFTWDSWVIDWMGNPDGVIELSVGGQKLPSCRRLGHTWHIYAPQVSYRHVSENPLHTSYDALWFFWKFNHPWPCLEGRPLTVLLDQEERLGPHVHAMAALAQHREPGSDVAIRGHAHVIFGEVLIASQRGHRGTPDDPWPILAPGSANAQNQRLLLKIDDLVMRRLARPPSIGELAERLHMSPSTMAHNFRSETGLSVMERVRWVRIREARHLLMLPDSTVKTVARQLGFSSPFHLSKVFTELVGMTPSEFIRQQRR